jgi:hypothetical protein
MKYNSMLRKSLLVLLLLSLSCIKTQAQSNGTGEIPVKDSIIPTPIIFTTQSASEYIGNIIKAKNLWRPSGDPLRFSLLRLLDQYNEPFDTVKNRLNSFDYGSIGLVLTEIVDRDSIPVRWLNDHTFILDTILLDKDPLKVRKTPITISTDTSVINIKDSMPQFEYMADPSFQVTDTIREIIIDSLYLKAQKIQLHQYVDALISPPVIAPDTLLSAELLADSSKVVITKISYALMANKESPFYIVPDEAMPDSLKVAVQTIMDYTETRDSILIYLNNADGRKIPYWLSTGEDDYYRFWIKNYSNDSLTVWIGNPTKYDLTLLLEDNVNVERREKKLADDIPITTLTPTRTLARLTPLERIPVYWKYGFASAFTLNQNYFSNWVKGGENSLTSMLDVSGRADYTNTATKDRWVNNGRLRYGSIVTKENGFRTNTDILELNSQYNKVMREKLDFSSVLYFKTQIAKGYKYPNDSVPVSKFLNPGTFTVGVGFEYKPEKNTRINFSPLSYRNTFVLDTVNINQRTHGIERGKRARQEMGGQLVIRNSMSILKGLNITNNIRLFSGYLDKPQNVDVDWEMSLDKQINWYFMIRLNLHMIYDDDIKFAVEDSEGKPVLLPDGSPKRVAKTQFKQFLGLTLSFKI